MKVEMFFEAGDLASFKGSKGETYVVSAGKDGNLYCSCPSWKFQTEHPADRTCKHIKDFVESAVESAKDRDFDRQLQELINGIKKEW